MKAEHTKEPLFTKNTLIYTKAHKLVAMAELGDFSFEQVTANAEFLVKAWNAHNELLTTARTLCDILSQRSLHPMLNAEEARLLSAANSLVMSLTEPPQECDNDACDNCGDCRD